MGHTDGPRSRADEKYFCLPEIEWNVCTKRQNRGNQEGIKAGERKKSMKTAR